MIHKAFALRVNHDCLTQQSRDCLSAIAKTLTYIYTMLKHRGYQGRGAPWKVSFLPKLLEDNEKVAIFAAEEIKNRNYGNGDTDKPATADTVVLEPDTGFG